MDLPKRLRSGNLEQICAKALAESADLGIGNADFYFA